MKTTNKTVNSQTLIRWALILTGSILAIRLISLGLYPLMDTTEARYGEIARIMAETGNWITPQFDYGVPFWGKPPLYAWASALSFKLFGVSEFAARLPHFLMGVMIVLLTWQLAIKQSDKKKAILAMTVLATTAVFIISIGAVMTDTALLLSITLTLSSFWQAWQQHEATGKSGLWGYLFFIGLAIGLLAKGPLALVLTGLPVFLWCLPEKRLFKLYSKLPWISGTLLMLALSLPWYLMAEQATPGFLDYFIVGEHFRRFVTPGWSGDLYGTAHQQPRGMIWLMWLQASMPWGLLLPLLWWANRKKAVSHQQAVVQKPWRLFLWCWMLTPMLFFSLSGNILWTYVLPAAPALALLVADYIAELEDMQVRRYLRAGLVMPVVLVLLTGALATGSVTGKVADDDLMATFEQQPDHNQASLVYLAKRSFSGQFYSNGVAKEVKSPIKLATYMRNNKPLYLVAKPEDFNNLPEPIKNQLEQLSSNSKHGLWRKHS